MIPYSYAPNSSPARDSKHLCEVLKLVLSTNRNWFNKIYYSTMLDLLNPVTNRATTKLEEGESGLLKYACRDLYQKNFKFICGSQ